MKSSEIGRCRWWKSDSKCLFICVRIFVSSLSVPAGGKSLLKWKGVMLSPDKSSGDKTPSVESCCDVTVISNPNDTMTNSNCSLNLNQFTTDGEGNQVSLQLKLLLLGFFVCC